MNENEHFCTFSLLLCNHTVIPRWNFHCLYACVSVCADMRVKIVVGMENNIWEGERKWKIGGKNMFSNLPNNNLKMVECVCVYLWEPNLFSFSVPKPLPQELIFHFKKLWFLLIKYFLIFSSNQLNLNHRLIYIIFLLFFAKYSCSSMCSIINVASWYVVILWMKLEL